MHVPYFYTLNSIVSLYDLNWNISVGIVGICVYVFEYVLCGRLFPVCHTIHSTNIFGTPKMSFHIIVFFWAWS